jgi:hypothetical protein
LFLFQLLKWLLVQWWTIVTVILSMATLAPTGALASEGPEITRVLYMSRWSNFRRRTDLMLAADPCLSVFSVPMVGTFSVGRGYIDPDHVNRRMRMYMPRNLDQLVNSTDVIILHDAPCGYHYRPEVFFDPRWASWFVSGVRDHAVSLTMWGGDSSWGGGIEGDYVSWGTTVLDTVLPYSSLGGFNPGSMRNCERRFVGDGDPLGRIPWEESQPIQLLNSVKPKPGARPMAEAVCGQATYPWIAWWRSGSGNVMGETEVFGSLWTTGLRDRMAAEWPWYQDFRIYLVYFLTERSIPGDIYRAHVIRGNINRHSVRASLAISVMDFVQGMGANTRSLYLELDELNGRKREAERAYREGRYDDAASIFSDMEPVWEELEARAVETKETALFWIYVIEWLVVTGTALVSGVFLWMTISRRILYREMATTRMTEG